MEMEFWKCVILISKLVFISDCSESRKTELTSSSSTKTARSSFHRSSDDFLCRSFSSPLCTSAHMPFTARFHTPALNECLNVTAGCRSPCGPSA